MKALAMGAALVGLATSVSVQAAPRATMATLVQQIDAGFVCPEALPDDMARKASLDAMARKMAAHGLNHAQGMAVLRVMLTTHRCGAVAAAEPVAEVAEAPEAAPAAPVLVAAVGVPHRR